jgi:2-dehydropantoate 2-reductase
MSEKTKIAIIGGGAIGCVMAGYLHQTGEEVLLVGKKDQISSICEKGLTIEGVRGGKTVSVKAFEQLEGEVDFIVLAVKTQDVASALEQHKLNLLSSPVVTIQNGVRADKILSQRIAPERIISSIVMFGATYLKPGEVVHNFEGDLILGNYLGGSDERVKEISRIMGKDFSVVTSEDVMGMKWLKLFVNLNNFLPALVGKSMQESFADLDMCSIGVTTLREGLQLVDRAGINLHSLPTYPEDRLRKITSLPVEESAKIFSQIMTNLSKEPLYGSILQSIRRSRPSEIDYINGEFVSLAKEKGYTAPLNEKVVEMVHQVEESNKFFSPKEVTKELRKFC